MKKNTKEAISITFNVAIILFIISVTYVAYTNKDGGAYDFCVEWNHDTYREDLLWKCFNFEDGIPICDWYFDDEKLIIHDFNNKEDYIVYECTRFAKSIIIESDLGMEIEEIVVGEENVQQDTE